MTLTSEVMLATEVLPSLVQETLKQDWTWKCSGCGRIIFKMEGSVIHAKCKCNTMNTLTIK